MDLERAREIFNQARGFVDSAKQMPNRVDRSQWQTCHHCGVLIPVVGDVTRNNDATYSRADTYTYVCPFCSHCHVGTPSEMADIREQGNCYECSAGLAAAYQCPQCSFPRGWKRVNCPNCGHLQPVFMPHWWIGCDLFCLQCVHCELVYYSLCVC